MANVKSRRASRDLKYLLVVEKIECHIFATSTIETFRLYLEK